MGKCRLATTTPALRPLDLGAGVRIDTPVILAPMSGVTDLPFRRLAKQQGAGMVVSEMIASWAMVRENRNTLRMAEVDGCGGVSAVQLAGCEPRAMAEAARIAADRGADLIDINFGCPVKKVAVGQQAGSALMRDEAAAGAILEATVNAVAVPVTLKMRMGWDHASLNAPRLARLAEQTGIRMVTRSWAYPPAVLQRRRRLGLHRGGQGGGRNSGHRQRRHPDRGRRGRGVAPVGGRRRDDRARLLRPALVPAQAAHFLRTGARLPEPPLAAQRDILLDHYHAMLAQYGTDAGLRLARKHVSWYSRGLPGSAEFRAEVNRMIDAPSVLRRIETLYDRLIAAGAHRAPLHEQALAEAA